VGIPAAVGSDLGNRWWILPTPTISVCASRCPWGVRWVYRSWMIWVFVGLHHLSSWKFQVEEDVCTRRVECHFVVFREEPSVVNLVIQTKDRAVGRFAPQGPVLEDDEESTYHYHHKRWSWGKYKKRWGGCQLKHCRSRFVARAARDTIEKHLFLCNWSIVWVKS
jgi:hypothetical protein